MKRFICAAVVGLAYSVVGGISQAAEGYTLLCEMNYSLNIEDTSKSGPTSGSTILFIQIERNGEKFIADSDDNCKITRYSSSESEFHAYCENRGKDLTVTHRYIINRYSGEYTDIFGTLEFGPILIHTGKCRKAQKRF